MLEFSKLNSSKFFVAVKFPPQKKEKKWKQTLDQTFFQIKFGNNQLGCVVSSAGGRKGFHGCTKQAQRGNNWKQNSEKEGRPVKC